MSNNIPTGSAGLIHLFWENLMTNPQGGTLIERVERRANILATRLLESADAVPENLLAAKGQTSSEEIREAIRRGLVRAIPGHPSKSDPQPGDHHEWN